jgi:hypothetical protein
MLFVATSSWHFVALPKSRFKAIRTGTAGLEAAWGSLRVKATIGKTSWATSIFPDKKRGTYLLPVKAEVRKREGIEQGDAVSVELELVDAVHVETESERRQRTPSKKRDRSRK